MEFDYHFLSSVAPFGSIIAVLAKILVNIAFGAAVFKDANRRHNQFKKLVLVSPLIWSLAVLLGGVFVAIGYWFVHYSSMADR